MVPDTSVWQYSVIDNFKIFCTNNVNNAQKRLNKGVKKETCK